MSVVRVALLGAGRAGMVHGRNFARGVAGARLLAVADADERVARAAAAELDCDVCCTNPFELIADDRVEAVVIASPTPTHAALAEAALRADKHVLC